MILVKNTEPLLDKKPLYAFLEKSITLWSSKYLWHLKLHVFKIKKTRSQLLVKILVFVSFEGSYKACNLALGILKVNVIFFKKGIKVVFTFLSI